MKKIIKGYKRLRWRITFDTMKKLGNIMRDESNWVLIRYIAALMSNKAVKLHKRYFRDYILYDVDSEKIRKICEEALENAGF